MKDMVAEPAHAGEVKRLTAMLKDRQRQLGDEQPLTRWRFDLRKQ